MLGDWQSFNDVYGTSNNPYDPARAATGRGMRLAARLAIGRGICYKPAMMAQVLSVLVIGPLVIGSIARRIIGPASA